MTDSFNLFADIELDEVPPPLAGVPAEAFRMVGWGTELLKKIGQPPAHGRAGWIDKLKFGMSIEEIRDRAERPSMQYLVSIDVDGRLSTGFSLLDYNAVARELVAQGYELYREPELIAGVRIDTWALRG